MTLTCQLYIIEYMGVSHIWLIYTYLTIYFPLYLYSLILIKDITFEARSVNKRYKLLHSEDS